MCPQAQITISANPNLEDCQSIRRKVFVEEQGIPEEIDFDGLDEQCQQFLLSVDEKPAATARVKVNKIQRVAVLSSHQGQGLGQKLMIYILEYYRSSRKQSPFDTMILTSQESAIGFYEKLGFQKKSAPFLEAGIPHVKMEIKL